MIKLKQYSSERSLGLESTVSNVVYDIDFIAKLVHGLNDSYRAMIGEAQKGDWDSLADEVKRSTLVGVAYIVKNPDATPAEVHAKWVDERTCEGWSFGEVMDPEAKTHPCLTAYEELPIEHRMKDHLYASTVKAVMATLAEDRQLAITTECDCGGYSPSMWN